MLLELRIENLLLIERAELRFGAGLNAITGETGAGKTVLAHALDLIMGGRAKTQIVRPGAPEAYVEGVFSVPKGLLEDHELASIAERLPDDAEELVLARRVAAGGRTSAFVQGRSAGAADLQALGSRLLAFYGQHEHRKLTLASTQLATLDGFAGERHLATLEAYRRSHREVVGLERELGLLREREGTRERDLDILRFELEEIEAAAPDPDEEAGLAPERERLRHAEALRGAAAEAVGALSGDEGGGAGASEALAVAESALAGQEGVDAELDGLCERVRSLTLEARELAGELRAYAEGLEADPERLQQLEERLDQLDRLKRKHGGTLEAVLEHADRCRAQLATVEGAEARTAELDERLEREQGTRAKLAAKLRKARRTAARGLEREVAAELEQLAMSGARLEVVLEDQSGEFGPHGRERVELRVATNPGMPVSPIREAASGGELSRVMLALAGQGSQEGGTTLVFDEIDAGIGGNTARVVGERLRALGERRQVVCITHLPQVASVAGSHFRIEKQVDGDRATAAVERVEGDELVAEIVRMMGADREDETASRHARRLLQAA